MIGPELTPQDERALAHLIELQIDTATEEKHIHEVTHEEENLDDGDN